MATDVECAYLAGLVDGEGTINLPRPKVGTAVYNALLRVTSTDEEVVDWIVDRFPEMRKYRRKERTKRRDGQGKPIFEAVVGDREGLRIIVAAIRPYIQIFRRQERLDTLQLWIDTPPIPPGRPAQPLCGRGHPWVIGANGKRRCPVCMHEWYVAHRPEPVGIGAPGRKRKMECKHGHDVSAVPAGKECPQCIRDRNNAAYRKRKAAAG